MGLFLVPFFLGCGAIVHFHRARSRCRSGWGWALETLLLGGTAYAAAARGIDALSNHPEWALSSMAGVFPVMILLLVPTVLGVILTKLPPGIPGVLSSNRIPVYRLSQGATPGGSTELVIEPETLSFSTATESKRVGWKHLPSIKASGETVLLEWVNDKGARQTLHVQPIVDTEDRGVRVATAEALASRLIHAQDAFERTRNCDAAHAPEVG